MIVVKESDHNGWLTKSKTELHAWSIWQGFYKYFGQPLKLIEHRLNDHVETQPQQMRGHLVFSYPIDDSKAFRKPNLEV